MEPKVVLVGGVRMWRYYGTVYRDVGHIGKRLEEKLREKAVQLAAARGWAVPAGMLTGIKEEEEVEQEEAGTMAEATTGMPASSSSSMGILSPEEPLPSAANAGTRGADEGEVVVGEDVNVVGPETMEHVEDLGALEGYDLKWTSETIVAKK